LLSAALPTAPLVGVALGGVVCAAAAAVSPPNSSKANPAARIMTG
jgi:gas vesicle protein